MIMLLFAPWAMMFFIALFGGGFFGFIQAGKLIRKTKTGATPLGTLLMALGSVFGLFGGWLMMLASEAQGLTDGLVNTSALVGFMVLGTVVTALGSFTFMRLVRLVHFSSTSGKNSNPPPSK